jgi:hypothetical protein
VRGALAGIAAVLLAGLAAPMARAQIARRVDRVQYSIHVDVAAQVDLAELRVYLAEATQLFQQDQGADDIPCCMSLQSDSLVVFGTPGDGLDVIEDADEFDALQGRRALVQTISWCGSYNPSLVGCAEQPGDTLVVGLDAGLWLLSRVIAHERGHNATLAHRDENCALMSPSVSYGDGCLNRTECYAFRQLLAGTTLSGTCDCMGPTIGDPADADGTACTSDGVAGTCHTGGLCDPRPANDVCAQATPLTGAVALVDENYNASSDGVSTCNAGANDVWYRYTPLCTGELRINTCDSSIDLQVSAQKSCTPGGGSELVCSLGCDPLPAGCRASGACASTLVQAGTPVYLRLANDSGGAGPFALRASCHAAGPLDRDGDGVADAADNCASWPNAAQFDTDANGIGDDCECGDENGDGMVDSSDLVAIRRATFTPSLSSPLCDTNADLVCDVRDMIGANAKIYGAPAYCSRYPRP